jgi:hypothetical protein
MIFCWNAARLDHAAKIKRIRIKKILITWLYARSGEATQPNRCVKSSSSGEILGIAQPEFLVLHYTISSVYDTSNSSNNKGDYSAGLVK